MQNTSDPRSQARPAMNRRLAGWSRVTKMLAGYAHRCVVRIESGPREVILDFDPDAMSEIQRREKVEHQAPPSSFP